MFLNSKKVFTSRDPIKYFESAPSELGRSGDGKRKILKSSLINKYFKDFSNHRKKTNREVAFSHKPLPNIFKYRDHRGDLSTI